MMGSFFPANVTSTVTPHVVVTANVPFEKRILRVLVVDDEEPIALLAKSILEKEGYRVYHAVNAAEAYNLFREGFVAGSKFDLVLMDQGLQGDEDGVSALQRMRETGEGFAAVLVTGDPHSKEALNFAEYGFQAVLAKPFGVQALLNCVSALALKG